MKSELRLKLIFPCALLLALMLHALPAAAQDAAAAESQNVIVIEPLFEYPSAPDEIEGLTAKSNYLMDHFWDSFDFKSKKAVDQIALNDAFKVYAVPMRWADKEKVFASVDNLIAKVSKNPTLLYQLTKSAEENLYGDRAQLWIDEVYLRFLNALTKNKKLPESRKARYKLHQKLLSNTLEGSVPPPFSFETPTGNKETFMPGLLTVIEFGDPSCSECRMAKLKMDTDVTFSSLVEKGKINVLFVIPDPMEGWQTEMTGYPSQWHIGASDTVSDIYDIRLTPTFYVIGSDGKIITKNVTVAKAMQTAIENVK